MRSIVLSLTLLACDKSSGTPSGTDLSVMLAQDFAVNLDMTTPAACNPVDPMSDGQACPATGCPAGTMAVGTATNCKCWQACDPDFPTQCPCDRRCAPLVRADMGVVGGACLLANGPGERCGESGGTGLNAEGCAQKLLCVNADDNGAFRYCVQDCTGTLLCPAGTSCLQLNGVPNQACVYNSANGGLAAGTACTPDQTCATGYLCDGTCKPQCDRAGATCLSGSCTAVSDGATVVGYVCK